MSPVVVKDRWYVSTAPFAPGVPLKADEPHQCNMRMDLFSDWVRGHVRRRYAPKRPVLKPYVWQSPEEVAADAVGQHESQFDGRYSFRRGMQPGEDAQGAYIEAWASVTFNDPVDAAAAEKVARMLFE